MRWIGRIFGLLAVLVVIAFAAYALLPADRIARMVEDRFEAATGRALRIDGDVRPGLWPEIGVRTGAVSISNADWAGSDAMIEAEDLSVGVTWAGLLQGDIRITGVELIRPVIRLSRAADGRGNWEMQAAGAGEDSSGSGGGGGGGTPSAPDTSETSASRTIALDEVRIADGTVIYAAEGTAPLTLSEIDATLTLPDAFGEAALTLAAAVNGAPITADVAIGQFNAFLSDGVSPLELKLGLGGGGAMTFEGEAGLQPMSATGNFSAALDGLADLAASAGTAAPDLPEGLGRDRLRAAGALTYNGDTASFRETKLTLDDNVIAGDATLTLAEPRPRIVARLSAGALDLSGLSNDEPGDRSDAGGSKAGSGGGGSKSDGAEGWSKEQIDVSGLRAVDADISLDAESIALTASQLGRTGLDLALEDGRLVTTIRELSAYDGKVDGQVVVNGRNGLSASADLAGSAIAISRLFAELLDFDRLVTLGDLDLSVLTAGNSMHELMNAMDGEGSFSFGAGEFLGLDLAGMIRNLDPGFVGEGAATIFDEITGTFRIEDGVVINDDLRLRAELMNVRGSGTVGLGGQTLDLKFVPRMKSGDAKDLRIPILVSGSWAAPQIRLDLEGVVDAKAEAEIERARDKLEKKAKQKALKELDADAGADPEEALRDKVENELKKGLKGLFD